MVAGLESVPFSLEITLAVVSSDSRGKTGAVSGQERSGFVFSNPYHSKPYSFFNSVFQRFHASFRAFRLAG
jgi:hypothetical protein